MIIRSQNKRITTTDLNLHIESIEVGKENIKRVFIKSEKMGTIGVYSTEEKAIKVLDMICEKYKEPIVRANYTDNESLIYANSVFQMPQDSEV